MNNDVLFSSNSNDWETPKGLFDKLNAIYNFNYDLACTKDNCLAHAPVLDSLNQEWHKLDGWLWLNPPYGRQLFKWIKKACDENAKGAKIIMLIPARTDVKAWHQYIFNNKRVTINFIKGRLCFTQNGNPILDKKGKPTAAPFPSAIIQFSSHNRGYQRVNTMESR